MASVGQHREETDNKQSLPPVIQSVDIMPTLCVIASFGQWYPDELQSSSCQCAGDMTLNDCSPALSTEVPSHHNRLLSGKGMSSTPAGKSEAVCRKKQSVCQQTRARSHVQTEQQRTKTDNSSAMWSSPKYSRVPRDNADRFETSKSQSVRISRPDRNSVGDGRSSRGSHRMESRSSKKSVAFARGDQSYSRRTSQHNRSDALKSVTSSSITETCWSTSDSEHSFNMCTGGHTANMFHSAAINTCRALDGTKEHEASKLMNFIVKLEPLLVWVDAFAVDSSECCADLLEVETSALDQANDGIGDSKALNECVVNGETEGFKSGFELPSADNFTFENTPPNRDNKSCGNITFNTSTVRIKTMYSVDFCDNSSLQSECNDFTPINILETCSNNDDNLRKTLHYNETEIYHRTGMFSNGDIQTLNHRRCFSSDNLCTTSNVDCSSSRVLSCSTDAVYAGSAVRTWPAAGRESPAGVKRAVPPTSQGDTDCLPAVTWSDDAALTDASQLPLTVSDHRETGHGRQTPPPPPPLTDELCLQAGASCTSMETVRTLDECALHEPSRHEPFQWSFVVVGRGEDDGQRLATSFSWQPHQSNAVTDKSPPPPLGVPLRLAADVPTVACCAAGVDSASYFSEPQSCLSVYPSQCGTDSVMGQAESLSTDDVSMQKNAVESLDNSSVTPAVSGRGDADVPGRSTRLSDSVGWASLLNPAQSGAGAGRIVPARDVAAAVRSTTATSTGNVQDDVGSQLTAVTLGWSSQGAPRDLRQLMSSDVQLAAMSGVVRPPAGVNQPSAGSSAAERIVQTVDHSTERDKTDAVLYSDDREGKELEDDDDGREQSGVTDEAVRYSAVCVGPGRQSAVSASQQDSRLSSQQSPAPLSDDAATRDARASAAVPARVTDESLAGGRTLETVQQNPPPAPAATAAVSRAASLTNSEQRPMCAVEQLAPVSDDDRQVEKVVETKLGGARLTSDVTCASDDVRMAGPPPSSGEASPSSVDMSNDSAGMMMGRSVPNDDDDDDDDVDRKLADELERLKNMVVSSTRTCDQTVTAVSPQPDDSSSSEPDPEESSVKDLDDASDVSCSDNEHSVSVPFAAGEAADSVLVCADVELPCTAVTPSETVTGLQTRHEDSTDVSREDVMLGAEVIADDSDSVTMTSEPSTDSLLPAASAVEPQAATCKVSCHAAASKDLYLDASMHFMLTDVNQTVSETSTDGVDGLLNSAENNAVVDVILEAERSLFSFLGVPYNTPSSNVFTTSNDQHQAAAACRPSSVLPDIVRDSQTFDTDAAEPSNHKSLKYDNLHSVCTSPFQNYYLNLPCSVSLGDRILDMSIKGGGSLGEGVERNEMTWSELKVLAEMFYAEQRLLAQLDYTCLHMQVA